MESRTVTLVEAPAARMTEAVFSVQVTFWVGAQLFARSSVSVLLPVFWTVKLCVYVVSGLAVTGVPPLGVTITACRGTVTPMVTPNAEPLPVSVTSMSALPVVVPTAKVTVSEVD
jgi:hypothetical protein